jgi:hypothetical protein
MHNGKLSRVHNQNKNVGGTNKQNKENSVMATKRRPKPRPNKIIEIDCGGKTDAQIVTELVLHKSGRFRLTPRVAKAIRELGDNPRKYRAPQAIFYGKQIKAGLWHDIDTAIRFQGTVCKDGQHRCGAVEYANTAIVQRLVTGLTDEAVRIIDHGPARTFVDTLHGEGYKQESLVSAITSKLYIYDHDCIGSQGRVAQRIPDAILLEHLRKHEDAIMRGVQYANKQEHVRGCPTSVIGASYVICERLDVVRAQQFFHILTGDGPLLHQATKLQKYYQKQYIAKRTTRNYDAPLVLWARLLEAWNNMRAGKRRTPCWPCLRMNGKLIEPSETPKFPKAL